MKTNDKTLADVQPGGRVRLGDRACANYSIRPSGPQTSLFIAVFGSSDALLNRFRHDSPQFGLALCIFGIARFPGLKRALLLLPCHTLLPKNCSDIHSDREKEGDDKGSNASFGNVTFRPKPRHETDGWKDRYGYRPNVQPQSNIPSGKARDVTDKRIHRQQKYCRPASYCCQRNEPVREVLHRAHFPFTGFHRVWIGSHLVILDLFRGQHCIGKQAGKVG